MSSPHFSISASMADMAGEGWNGWFGRLLATCGPPGSPGSSTLGSIATNVALTLSERRVDQFWYSPLLFEAFDLPSMSMVYSRTAFWPFGASPAAPAADA